MASPRPFYPLQQPATTANSVLDCCPESERSTPVHFQLRARTAPVVAAMRLCRVSAATSPFPAKSPAPRQSLRTTSLPDPAESASSGTAPALSSTLLPPGAALRDAPRCQTENPHDPSARPALHSLPGSDPRTPPARSMSLSLYAGTTTAAGSPPHATRCGRPGS